MQKLVSLRLQPHEATDESTIRSYLATSLNVSADAITGYYIIKKSIDARSRIIWVNLTLMAFANEPYQQRIFLPAQFKDVHRSATRVIIIGAGPAGLFAALRLLELGIKPVILERGKDVRARRRDLSALNRLGIVNPNSNYCFGEGGAGTYSDGKLYTRSNKRGQIDRILHHFVRFGADERILFEAHPHIGTNKLPGIISAMRQLILDCGGEYHFNARVSGFRIQDEIIRDVLLAEGAAVSGDAVLLATGHSARDIFELLHAAKLQVEAKPFALGVRVEHPQALINQCQYKANARSEYLPPASYSLVQQVNGKGVFSFCMCPGGIIAPAATAAGEQVVNGWSPSKRNNPFANSGMVVEVAIPDLLTQPRGIKNPDGVVFDRKHPLALMYFQQMVERACYEAGGGYFCAPAQRMVDFVQGKLSNDLPDCSYIPGVNSVNLPDILPDFISNSLQQAFQSFGSRMKGYYTNEAILVATESRTSSPVRIPRLTEALHHPQVKNLYPCGEGAGYAGGIVSAAMDGERIADQLALILVS